MGKQEILLALIEVVFGDRHNPEGMSGLLEHDEHGLGDNCDKNSCSKCRLSQVWEKYPEIEKIMKDNDLWE